MDNVNCRYCDEPVEPEYDEDGSEYIPFGGAHFACLSARQDGLYGVKFTRPDGDVSVTPLRWGTLKRAAEMADDYMRWNPQWTDLDYGRFHGRSGPLDSYGTTAEAVEVWDRHQLSADSKPATR